MPPHPASRDPKPRTQGPSRGNGKRGPGAGGNQRPGRRAKGGGGFPTRPKPTGRTTPTAFVANATKAMGAGLGTRRGRGNTPTPESKKGWGKRRDSEEKALLEELPGFSPSCLGRFPGFCGYFSNAKGMNIGCSPIFWEWVHHWQISSFFQWTIYPAKIFLGIPSTWGAPLADFPGFCGYSGDTGEHVDWMVPKFPKNLWHSEGSCQISNG